MLFILCDAHVVKRDKCRNNAILGWQCNHPGKMSVIIPDYKKISVLLNGEGQQACKVSVNMLEPMVQLT